MSSVYEAYNWSNTCLVQIIFINYKPSTETAMSILKKTIKIININIFLFVYEIESIECMHAYTDRYDQNNDGRVRRLP